MQRAWLDHCLPPTQFLVPFQDADRLHCSVVDSYLKSRSELRLARKHPLRVNNDPKILEKHR